MKSWIRRIALALAGLALIAAGMIGWLLLSQQPIPDLGPAPAGASLAPAPGFAPVVEKAREKLAGARTRLAAPAVSIAVAVRGEIVWAEARGVADLESRESVGLDSRFPIGSISKSITATAAARLSESGRIDLDKDIHAYLPLYPPQPHPITLRQLLSHQAGVRHYGFAWAPPLFNESALNREFRTTAESLALFANDPLRFPPDTGFLYSTFGYTLAGAALEGATGRDLLELLALEVFRPAGMIHTEADRRDRRIERRVSDHLALTRRPRVLRAPETNSSYKWAGGGLVSTPSDLVRFGSALLDGKLVGAGMRRVMFTPREIAPGRANEQNYGLGFRAGGLYYPRDSENLIPLIQHGGTAPGGVSILLLQPESGIVIAMTANSSGRGGSDAIRGEAAAILRDFLDHLGFVPRPASRTP